VTPAVDLALHACGPCDTDGPAVRDHLPDGLTTEGRDFILTRLDHGEAHYGAPLRIGWPGAAIEAPQESADLCAYLRAANAPAALIDRAAALHNDVVRWAQGAR
jgi:hypothetical protein